MEAKVITLLNKLPRKDSVTGLDVWYKTILHDITYSSNKVTNVNGTTVSMGQTFKILFPFDERYSSYNEWKSNPLDGYTVNQGDYIFIGVEIEDDVTPNNIQTIKNRYEPMVCEVRIVNEVIKRFDTNYQLMIEGV